MEKFKDILGQLNITFTTVVLGAGASQLFLIGNHKAAAYLLLITTIMYGVGYFTERWTK